VAGINAARLAQGLPLVVFPSTTMVGALCGYVCGAAPDGFQPMKANFGLLPPLEPGVEVRTKRERYAAYAQRSLADLDHLIAEAGI
jgi:methylenetetrahydrofolate--tRNA-(uracil-5-)-methyltransferase